MSLLPSRDGHGAVLKARNIRPGCRGLLSATAINMVRSSRMRTAREGSSVKRVILNTVEKELAGDGRRRGGVKLPLVRSKRPGTLRLTNEEVYDAIPFP
jgi:hypothetical protein